MVLSASVTAKSTSMQIRHTKQCTTREVNFTLMMQEKSYPNSYPISTFFWEDFPANRSASPEQELNTLNTGSPKSIKLFEERRCSIACEFLTACGWKRVSTACTDEGYDVCWQVLNSKNFGVPQSRKRVFISDILEGNVPEKYYLSRKQAEKLLYKENPTQGKRIYSSKGLSCTLTSGSGGFGGHSGLYLVEDTENFGLPIKSKTKDGYQIAYPGDSIDTAFSGQNSRRGRVGSQVAHTLTTSATQAYYFIDLNPDPKLTEIARCITARQDSGISNRKAEHSGVFVENSDVLDDNEKFAVAFVEPNGEVHIGRIRKLTPRECWRLQGFTDEHFDKARATGLSDSRLYKMAGNAVTVNVISAIGEIIKKVDSKN